MKGTYRGVRSVALLALAGLVLAGCSTTKLVDVWRSPTYQEGTPLGRTLVLAMTDKPGTRQMAEQDLTARLRAKGVDAVEALTIVPIGQPPPDRETFIRKLEEAGIQSVVVSQLVGKQTKVVAEPAPMPYAGPGFYDFYYGAYPVVYSGTYLNTEEVVTIQTRVFTLKGKRGMIWSAHSQTVDPTKVDSLIESVDTAVVAGLEKDQLI